MKNSMKAEEKKPVRIPDSMEAGLTDDDLTRVNGGDGDNVKQERSERQESGRELRPIPINEYSECK